MLLRCIISEKIKIRHSVIFPACIIIPIIPAIMGTFNYLQNTGILKDGWYSLWTQATLFYATFFYAPLIALYCSYLWRLEHRGNNWNVFMSTPVSIPCLFFGKLSIILLVTFFTQVWVGILFFICGKFIGFPGFFPAQILFWLLRGTMAAIAIGALQLFISMVIRSFAVPIGIALAGSAAGMLFTNKGLGLLWPYALMLTGMNSNKSTDSLTDGLIPFVLSTVLFFLIFCSLAVWLMKKRDVHTA